MSVRKVFIILLAFNFSALFAQPGTFNDQFIEPLQAATAAFGSLLDFSESIPATPMIQGGMELPKKPYKLEALLFFASVGNPTLRGAQSSINAAKADLTGAKAQRLPTLKVETSGSYIGNPIGPISVTAGEFGEINGILLPATDMLIFKGMESSNYKFGIVSDIPLYTWGKISQGIDIATQGLRIAEIQLQKTRHEIGIKIRANYEALAYLNSMYGILELEEKIGKRLLDIAEKSETSGFLTKTELLNTRIKLKEAEIALAKVSEQRNKILVELARSCGIPDLALADLSLEASKIQKPHYTEAEALEIISQNSYDIRTLTTLIDIKKRLHTLAKTQARGFPDIGLHLELSYAGSRFPFLETDWFRKDDYQFTVSLGTSGNIFGNAVQSGKAVKAAAEYDETVEKKQEALLTIRGVIRETYLGLELGKIKLEYAILKQEGWQQELSQQRKVLAAGAGAESDYLSLMMQTLGGLAEAYGTIIEYRSLLITLEAMAGQR